LVFVDSFFTARLSGWTKSILLLVCIALPLPSSAAIKSKTHFEVQRYEKNNIAGFPQDYAYAMFQNVVARMVFGEHQSVVEPLYFMAEQGPDLADVQNALAVAIYFGLGSTRHRAHYYSSLAITLEPEKPEFRVVYILSDKNHSHLSRDGHLFLTSNAVHEFRFLAEQLTQGSANQRLLAELLNTISRSDLYAEYPFQLEGFDRLVANQLLLVPAAERSRFDTLEEAIETRIHTLKTQVEEAKQKAEAARTWFAQLKEQEGLESGEAPVFSSAEQEMHQRSFKKWVDIYEQKLQAMNEEFAKLSAFIEGDTNKLLSLRVKYDKSAVSSVSSQTSEHAYLATTSKQEHGTAQQKTYAENAFGNYHAIVIGNNSYSYIEDLVTAQRDATEVARLLEEKYQFNVKLLQNVSRSELLGELYKLRSVLTEKDNLLIYYGGHGYFDSYSDSGYWLPVDADTQNPSNWISNTDLTDQIRAMKAKHVLVVADSCYSGTLTRDVAIRPPDKDYLERIAGLRARLVISSGGNEPVADSGPNGHSIFANAFLEALTLNSGVLESTDLFNRIRRRVAGSPRAIQVPNYGVLRDAIHDGGDFLFVSNN